MSSEKVGNNSFFPKTILLRIFPEKKSFARYHKASQKTKEAHIGKAKFPFAKFCFFHFSKAWNSNNIW